MFDTFDPNLSVLENLEVKQTLLLIIFSIFAIVAPITVKFSKTEQEKGQNAIIWCMLLAVCGVATLLSVIAISFVSTPYVTNDEHKQILENRQYESLTSKERCYLCNDNAETRLSTYWNENNVAIVDLNTFDFFRIEINRYSDDGVPIKREAGYTPV